MGPQEVVLIGTVLAVLALPMIALGDLLRQPAWPLVRHSRLVWVAIILGLPVVGAALYLRRVKPALGAAATAR